VLVSDELLEIELRNGILAFDGRVLERFGFGAAGREGTRMHVNEIEELTLKGNRLKAEGRARSSINAHLEFDEAQLPELESFLATVRAAAPNLKEAR
jgi:hypothetical protein